MTARELFGVLVRCAGVVLVALGLIDLIDVGARLSGLSLPPTHTVPQILAGAVVYLASGVVVFASAGAVTWLAYGRRKGPT